MKAKPNVALLVGGTSPEREVSKLSGKGVLKALKALGYPTTIVDPAYGLNQPKEEESFFAEKDFAEISNRNCIDAINSDLLNNIDVVFSAMHGKWAEDGTIQSLLELRGLKYTGSKVAASAVAMDKNISKRIFKQVGVNTANWSTISDKSLEPIIVVNQIKKEIGFPCIIKPNDQGSTVGLKFVKDESEVEEGIFLALQYSSKVLVEKYIAGREIAIGILGSEALPVLEIIPKSGLYDYKSKYTPGMSEYIVPAQIPDNVTAEAQRQALLAFQSLGCEGYGRVDLRMNDQNEIFCLEVNTLPGMTSLSLVPKAAKAIGILFEELIDRIIQQEING
ncbi:MAG: D-alanine--D-alanine ligase [Ignavibacteria bacterium]|nr:D-alanine--D-alanine ligase [Ignavibacteria bacterium]MBT8383583.1 D-alanine--D-alanine ligase [Ignavibacteria bacterium]MBT8390675.1 D-alanine--D-alanine ligase [Ignavibacteria bacterium]NNJ51725.1 D-alanine--D-alanine ligase [Ignavibacteriaceae bacterium]NNL20716.1 D-alanine--D-alanine ligase [Ignavibacteriaceae bacterium]